jgi:hypothetical protein
MISRIYRIPRAALLGMSLLAGAGAVADDDDYVYPSNVYACQVQIEGGRVGIVMMQSQTLEKAQTSALVDRAFATDGTRGRAIAVDVCVAHPGARFPDPDVQRLYESLDDA